MPKLTLTLVTAGIVIGTAGSAVPAPYGPKVGQRHPDFTLPLIDGRAPVSLSAFRGKKVLLVQFASW